MIEQIATKVMGWAAGEVLASIKCENAWLVPAEQIPGAPCPKLIYNFNPLKDWNDTMKMEARLRELNRWDYYVLALMEENGTVQILEDGRPEVHCSAGYLLASTQEQRCRAALKAVSDD